MAKEAFKILADTTFHLPTHTSVTMEGVVLQETIGVAYAAGDYVFPEELTERDLERAQNGELDHLLEPADRNEAEVARSVRDKGLFIPEHEAERYALLEAGHGVIEKDQVLDLRSAGEDAAAAALAESKEGPNEGNPLITEQASFAEVGDITTSVNEGKPVLPGEGKQPEVSPEEIAVAQSSSDSGVEFPPGLPVGEELVKAAGGEPEEKPKRRRPGAKSTSSDSPEDNS